MSNNSEAVKRNRENRKDLMISAFGGKCGICGYNKSQRALHFHHINPELKSFGIATVRANPMSWDKLVVELRKCVLLCSNCHYELHDNLIKLPSNVTKFNIEYNNAKLLSNIKDFSNIHECNYCKKIITTRRSIYCSILCRDLDKQKVDWSKEKDNLLYFKNTEKMSFVELGTIYKVSDKTVAKWYYKFNSLVAD